MGNLRQVVIHIRVKWINHAAAEHADSIRTTNSLFFSVLILFVSSPAILVSYSIFE